MKLYYLYHIFQGARPILLIISVSKWSPLNNIHDMCFVIVRFVHVP